MEKLKVGDVVVLKSGGPNMTVYSVKENDICCVWFNENDVGYSGPYSNDFKYDQLDLILDLI